MHEDARQLPKLSNSPPPSPP